MGHDQPDLEPRTTAMKFPDLLAKLGILRSGAKAATYRSGTERPTELLMDDVYNAERDLTTAKDVAAIRSSVAARQPAGKP